MRQQSAVRGQRSATGNHASAVRGMRIWWFFMHTPASARLLLIWRPLPRSPPFCCAQYVLWIHLLSAQRAQRT